MIFSVKSDIISLIAETLSDQKGSFIMLKAICSRKELTVNSYYGCIEDLIGCDQLEKLKEITHHIHTTRFQHCVNVSYYSYLVCRRLRLNARSAARAGLLHDLFYYDRKEYNLCKVKGQLSHSQNHAYIASENARMLTDVSPLEKDMIEKHMWPMTKGRPGYKETYVITIIDKYCAVLEFCVPKLKKMGMAISGKK